MAPLVPLPQPDAVIHFAEQRAAPYSMKSSFHKRYTVDNNLNASHNLLAAIVESGLDTHVIPVEHPPAKGDRAQIFNQITEIYQVRDLAKMVFGEDGCGLGLRLQPAPGER